MKYEQKSFTVPASAGSADYCAEHGHTMPDVRGKCVRCGAKVHAFDFLRIARELTAADPFATGPKKPS